MTRYRYFKDAAGKLIREAMDTVPTVPAMTAAAAASGSIGIEAYRTVPFEELPAEVIQQLRTDGMHGGRRTEAQAQELYDQRVPAEAHGSVEGVEAIVADPTIDAMHIQPHKEGGSGDASNIVYGPESLNSRLQETPMNGDHIAEAEAFTLEVAEQATPGVTGDLGEVMGDTLETGALGGVLGGGLAAVHRMAQAQGFRDAGRPDLAAMAEEQIAQDVTNGAVNGVVRGTAVAVTQAVLGANPLTAGIGLVAPDAVMLLTQKKKLSEEEYNQKATEVVAKGALATALVCAGPIGWFGLAGLSIASAYGKASSQAGGSQQA